MPFDQSTYQPPGILADPILNGLIAARKVIEEKRNWCQGALHKPGKRADNNVRYCALGAIERIAASDAGLRLNLMAHLAAVLPRMRDEQQDRDTIGHANDVGGHKLITRAFDLAIVQRAREVWGK